MNQPVVAAIESLADKAPAPAGMTYVLKHGKYVLVPNTQTPEVATAASQILASASPEPFLNSLFPIKVKEIEVGDRVWNRSTQRFGQVIRASEGAFRVDTDGMVGTYWEQELEVR